MSCWLLFSRIDGLQSRRAYPVVEGGYEISIEDIRVKLNVVDLILSKGPQRI
ncbi:MAG TPA: hypothetical protein VMW38_06335 [Terriglobia bacterium]|nr:hypothetical protein [Terriglobia bacterium]